jgi:hypothetical protein
LGAGIEAKFGASAAAEHGQEEKGEQFFHKIASTKQSSRFLAKATTRIFGFNFGLDLVKESAGKLVRGFLPIAVVENEGSLARSIAADADNRKCTRPQKRA